MPRPITQIDANLASSLVQNEEVYVGSRTQVERALQKSLQIRNALASLEAKLERAVAEYEAELEAITSNFRNQI